jgi:type IV pilus assembly protein PilE
MKCPHPPPGASGWGLVECLMVVALGAALTAMALPLSTAWGQRLQRAQARTALAQAAWWMERESALSGVYPTQLSDSAWASDGLNYRLVLAWGATGYLLSATPVATQLGDACGTLWLHQSGQRGADGGLAACW